MGVNGDRLGAADKYPSGGILLSSLVGQHRHDSGNEIANYERQWRLIRGS